MELVTGAMGSVLSKLLELLKDEYNLQSNLRSSIDSLYKELDAMQAALCDVAKIAPDQRDKVLDLWASDVRDLSYDAEDILDSLPSHLGLEGSSRGGTIKFFSRVIDRHDIAGKINDIKARAKQVASRRSKYTVVGSGALAVHPPATTSSDPRLLAHYKEPKEIVGIKDSRDAVIRKLRHGGYNELGIVSIVGIGGLGKTTLANAVYDRIQVNFECRAFVSVSRNPDIKKVLRDILIEIDKQKYRSLDGALWDVKQLTDEVRRQLVNKRYLIVIDDIWDSQTWEMIKSALIDSKCQSRVVTTTRNYDVAEEAGGVYKLKALSDKDSEALFNKRRFHGKEEVPAVLPEVSEKLLRKCGGVPLAIITMASLLAKKHADDWSKVYEKIGFGSDVEGNKDVVNTRKILMFSYYDLPDHLRACLLHLHIFPEDYVIKKETLIWKWAAEGFIVEHEETGLFELGERYFNELVNRNVIMPVEDDSHGGIIIGCRVHDLFLDIIYSESTAENFVVVLNGTTANKQKLHSGRKARRLGVHKRAAEQVNFLVNICQESVRSFSATMCHFKSEVSLSRFKVLRVLAIEECTFAKASSYNLKSIGCLVRLRYLGLYNTPIDELPKEIGNLTDLQTLDLRGTNIKELPGRVALLRQLKCLRADDTTAVPDWIGELTSLEELRLDDVSNSVNFVKELGKLTELRELQIWIEDFDEKSNKALVESMGNLRKIQVLGLESSMQGEEANWEGYVPPSQLRDLRLTIASSGLPAWINVSRVPFLLHLCVDVKAVEEQDLDILGALPELISLELIMPPDVFPTIKGAFPKLRCFDTSAPFRFLEEAMPRLESLRFKVTVPALKRAGFDFEFATLSNLPCLQTVEVEISCRGARANNSQVAEAAVKRAVQAHPEGPILTIKKTDK